MSGSPAESQRLLEIHRELGQARTPRELRGLLRAAALNFPGHLSDCATCTTARDRVEDPATELHGRVEHDLSWHPPRNQAIEDMLERLRIAAKNFAHEVVDSTPVCDEQRRALEGIDDALKHAIAGAVRHPG